MTPFALKIARQLLELSIHDCCDGKLKKGIEHFGAGLTTSYSLTSRNPSLSVLARRCMDQPVRDLLLKNRHRNDLPDLQGLLPSQMMRAPPRVDQLDAKHRVRLWPRAGHDEMIRRRLINISLWDRRIHTAIRCATDSLAPSHIPLERWVTDSFDWVDSPSSSNTSKALSQWSGSLNTLRLWLDSLYVMLPTSTPLEDQLRRQKTAVVRTFCEPKPYCDLCWRHTVRYAALTLAGFKTLSAPGNLSPRYCEYHLPIEDPPEHNCYRSDNRYREAFHDELWALLGRQRSKYVFRFQPPRNADIQEVRKAAYDTVHSGVRPLRSIHASDESFAERVWRLHLAGSAQADIARRLSVHRQTVSRTLKRLKEIAAKQAIDAEIDPSTGEMFSLHSDATRPLFDTVRACRAEGASTAEIAQSIGRFKQTVKSVQRWLSVIDAIEAAQRRGASLHTVAARYRLSISFIQSLASQFAREPERHEYEEARVHENKFRFGSSAPKSMPSRP